MCLLVVAWRVHPRYRLVVAANRDEFHDRPAEPLAFWAPPATLLAGRDVRAGGTWLGVDRQRRFGVITNFREPVRPRPTAPSRGRLIVDFLSGASSAADYAARIESDAMGYAGFSLLLADDQDLVYACNRADDFVRRLPPGIYGLSNHLLDTPWPKLRQVRTAMAHWIESGTEDPQPLWAALADRTVTEDDGASAEVARGLDPAWAQVLASPFVAHPQYGTRCSTLSLIADNGALQIHERRFDAAGRPTGDSSVQLDALAWGH